MSTGPDTTKVRQALADIIDGRTVKRARHSLSIGYQDFSALFVQVLQEKGYLPYRVKEIDVRPGERIPAFLIHDDVAYFGWVFWEKFSDRKMRRLFGSVVRNAKGDWAVQIPDGKATPVFANPSLKTDMDIDNPSGF
jgi:hypothetical protein